MKVSNKKFLLGRFKVLRTIEEMVAYGKMTLTVLGQGSGRITFAYRGGKVLKIALNDKGCAQNEAEKYVQENEATSDTVASIYDFGIVKDQVAWLISQIVRPITKEPEFRKLTGFSWDTFVEVIREFAKSNAQGDLRKITGEISSEFSKRAKQLRDGQDERNARYFEKKLEDLRAMENSTFIKGIISAMAVNRLMPGDLTELDHYGKTTDGRIVLLDYGFTEEVANAFYRKEEPADKGAPVCMMAKIGLSTKAARPGRRAQVA